MGLEPGGERGSIPAAAGAAAVAMAVVGIFFLAPYAVRALQYPVGWDSAFYVWRGNLVLADGLDQIGLVRSATPLLLGILRGATGMNGFTLVIVLPVLMAALVGLGAAALVRVGVGTSPIWVPFIALVTWIAFGRIGMMSGHLDNVVNAALVLAGFAAVAALLEWGRGAVAAGALFATAALAHWPFYVFAMGVLVVALLVHALPDLRAVRSERRAALRPVGAAAAAVLASGAVAAGSFLVPPPEGGIGIRLGGATAEVLRERFLRRLGDTIRYAAVPLAAAGAWLAAGRAARPMPRGRRFLLALAAAWVLATIVAGAAQLAGLPTAGGRLLHYLFAVPILAAVFVWGAARLARERMGGAAGRVLPVLLALATIVGFGTVAGGRWLRVSAWIEPEAVRQTAAAGPYVERVSENRRVVYVMDHPERDGVQVARWWNVVRASMPPDQLSRACLFAGSPDEYRASDDPCGGWVTDPWPLPPPAVSGRMAVLLSAYNPPEALQEGTPVAPGVVTIDGPQPGGMVPDVDPPVGAEGWPSLLFASVALAVVVSAAGAGWALALLPRDWLVRACLAPALGVAAVVLAGTAVDLAGLPVGDAWAWLPIGIAALGGWIAATIAGARAPGWDARASGRYARAR